MTNRIVGQNSGIDVDTVVKQSLSTEQTRIDKAYQKQKVYEYEQEQLKEIVNSSTEFYDKYLDILSSDNLLTSSAYETMKFTSSEEKNPSVTAKGFAGADVAVYSVSINSLAEKAKTTLTSDDLKSAVDSGKGVFSFEIKSTSGESKKMYVDLPIENGEVNMSSLASAVNSELKKSGISANAKYSEFAKGIVLESTNYGEDVTFGIAVKSNASIKDEGRNPSGFTYSYYSGKNAKGTITKGNDVYQIDKPSNVVTVDNVEFNFTSVTNSKSSTKTVDDLSADDLNNKVTLESLDGKTSSVTKEDRNLITKKYSDGITLKTTNIFEKDENGNIKLDENSKPIIKETKTNVSGDLTHLTAKDKDVNVEEDSENGLTTITKTSKDSSGNSTTKKTIIDTKNNKTTTTYEHDGVQVTTVTTKETVNGKEKSTTETKSNGNLSSSVLGDKYKTTIDSKDGKTKTTIINSIDKDGKAKVTTTTVKSLDDGSSVQKVITNTNGTIDVSTTETEPVKLTGKTDVSNLKDTIVKFVNDYNKLMESIDKKLWETRDTDYMPLTDDQKSAMTDKQIEEWEKKAKTGLLRSDSDLQRIQRTMKSAMSSLMSGTGLTLEQIGIKPVNNYTTKNGMYTVDESKLTKALESNSEEVKDLFTRKASGNDKGGVLVRLQSVLKDEVKSSTSILSQRIGFEGTATESSNTLSKNILAQKKLIKELKQKYSTQEDRLYKKYSNLETMMEKLNSQTNSLMSLLGNN